MENPALVVALGGLLLNLLVTVIGGVWKLSRMELVLRQAINEASRDTDEQIERHVRYFGEGIAAVRHKITEVELFCRDTFIRKDELQSQIKALSDKLDRIQ